MSTNPLEQSQTDPSPVHTATVVVETPTAAASAVQGVSGTHAASAPENGFVWSFKAGGNIRLPKFNVVMTFGRARRLRRIPADEQMLELLEEICDADALALLDRMDAHESSSFFVAWQKDAQVSLGESGA